MPRPPGNIDKILAHGTEFHDAGMTNGQIARAEQRLAAAEAREARNRDLFSRRELIDESEFGSNASMPELPPDFVEDAVAQLREKVRVGNFEAVRDLADSLEKQWELRQVTDSPLAGKPLGIRLATYLSECRDSEGNRIGTRIVNCVESVCPATLGSILERWPMEFLSSPNMGPQAVRMVGKVLLSAKLIEVNDFNLKFDAYVYAYKMGSKRRMANGSNGGRD